MFALNIRYLNGWSMATEDGARKERTEWPPHPDRVFMALAAAWFETGENSIEGEALHWLESLPPPAIAASDHTTRSAVLSYVPVNDLKRKPKSTPADELKSLPTKKLIPKLKEGGLALLPKYRSRQARGFPVAIPHDPTVRLIWQDDKPGIHHHHDALEQLAAKVTHIGHSASFAQMWLDKDVDVAGSWIPTDGIAQRRLRIPFIGRLDGLRSNYNRDQWIAYHDLEHELEQAKADIESIKYPPRVPWGNFVNAVLLVNESALKQHPEYPDAKTGNSVAAANLVDSLVDEAEISSVGTLLSKVSENGNPILVSANAYERQGFNAIPSALAKLLSKRLGIPFDTTIVQTNIVSHTGADGYGRLARQAAFEGKIARAHEYVMVDDFIGQGGTLANLRGWIEMQGGKVIGAVALTGKPYSATLNPSQEQLHELRQKHGPDFEKWWKEHFGHSFDCLTQSEARYLTRSPDADTIRNRIAEAMRERSRPSHGRSPREQRKYINDLKTRLKDRFPKGPPVTLRPRQGQWHGYTRPEVVHSPEVPGSVFDLRFIVLSLKRNRVSLPATLKFTTALRGLLMGACPMQPPPEWFSGHRADGTVTTSSHLALTPLPFVGSEHADGRILGLGLVLPTNLDQHETKHCLEPFLYDSATGLPREHRLFDGRWFECALELETRERSPTNLVPNTWIRPSRVWASVTPVVLNRHFNGKDMWKQAAESVKDACEHIALPRPREVFLHPVSLVEGVPPARNYPQLTRKKDGGKQSHTHALIVFNEPVSGPLLIGAGRFRGYGLCRPIDN